MDVEEIVAGTAFENIRTGIASQDVVTAPADQMIVHNSTGIIPVQGVGEGRTDDVLEAGNRIAIGVAADPAGRLRGQIDRHARRRSGIGHGIAARAVRAAGQLVCTRTASDDVVTTGAVDLVVDLRAGDRFVVAIAQDRDRIESGSR
ncbi:MAG: hypothetical protein R3D89_12140 [Sphingomonadaceae bacterium]